MDTYLFLWKYYFCLKTSCYKTSDGLGKVTYWNRNSQHLILWNNENPTQSSVQCTPLAEARRGEMGISFSARALQKP